MGNVICSSENNDELIDALRILGYIKTKTVERVFRAVDRGDYVFPSHRDVAYKDLSWKVGNIHLSAPCVYSKVMEGLSLEPGLSFLNLGSGTGYLSTMVGLILNHHGTNHGVEINKDCLDYAYEKLDEFKQKSLALDEFDFCEPVFIHGSCLNLEQNRQYDRVYCGAACPENFELFIKQFVKIGGILVMPYKDHLLRIERIDEDNWKHKAMLPVSFATLILPKIDDQSSLQQLPYSQPLSLQELCRCSIRNKLRKSIWLEHPELETKDPIKSGVNKTQPQRSYPHYVVPLYENYERPDSTLSDDEHDQASQTHLLLYVDAHPDEDVTTLQVVRAMAPSRSSTNDNNLTTTTSTTTTTSSTTATTTTTRQCNSDYFNVIDSDVDDDSLDSIEPRQQKSRNCQLTKTKNRKFIYSLSDDSDDEEESPNDTPKKSRMLDDHGYLKLDNDSVRITNEYIQTTQNDDTSPIDETTDRLNDNTDKIESDNSLNDTNNIKCNNINNLHEQYESIAGQSNTNNTTINNDKKKRILLSVNSSFNDSEDDHDDYDKKDELLNKIINNDIKNSWNDSDDEGSCPLMDWSTSTIKPQTKWGIPEGMCNNDVNSCTSTNSITRTPQIFSHNVDINAFSYHMKNKISQLPLPMSLRLYINYNRVL
ncbi:hypothetical protein HCN44_000224 [Aphidius gifuensis]|uniref:Uncharacterized protein n=1 Tax=Aphidius gifuensis TaxID=684658 RepID=A0A835CN34_APHGI|nr:protein-L-isoaspartate O-methyltransferase domain-containing protein 1-like [Aphidius gifuensis]KAF7990419.1 hypothetical protein HCN44_000224 [Aphidius gifuensis]